MFIERVVQIGLLLERSRCPLFSLVAEHISTPFGETDMSVGDRGKPVGRTALVLGACLLLPTSSLAGQGTPVGGPIVRGWVTEAGSGIPLSAAQVDVRSGQEVLAAFLTDEEGFFRISLAEAGTYVIRVEHLGYEAQEKGPFVLPDTGTFPVDFQMVPVPIPLDSLLVTASMAGMEGFRERYSRYSRSRFGEFMIRDSLAANEGHYSSTGHMLAMRFMSVREVISAGPRYGQVILRGITPPTGFGPPGACVPTYFIDGNRIPREAVADGGVNPMLMYPPSMLEAVEVYTQPNVPAEFLRGEWPCGVVALWTRVDPEPPGGGVPGWKKLLAGAGILALALLLGR